MKEIKIFSLKYGGKKVLVDDEDYEYLNRWKWHLSEAKDIFYAMRFEYNADGTRYHVSMHRVIMSVYDPKIFVDHRDHNGLNNQKSNLRKCSDGDNKKNREKKSNASSKYAGVFVRVRKTNSGESKRWISHLGSKLGDKEGKKHFPYTPEGEIQAAKRYDELAKKYYGEFANLNFKEDGKED